MRVELKVWVEDEAVPSCMGGYFYRFSDIKEAVGEFLDEMEKGGD